MGSPPDDDREKRPESRGIREGREQAHGFRLKEPATIIGESSTIREIKELIATLASLEVARILLTGEPGTGKDLIAQWLHWLSARREGPFVPVNCASLADGLIESELYGHEPGAFTGAIEKRLGRFVLAHRGTLFLNEFGELLPRHQAKLLDSIMSGMVMPCGSDKPVSCDIRFVAATNADLKEAVVERRFRKDLLQRFRNFTIHIPPLRERQEDILPLFEHFLARHARALRRPRRRVTGQARRVLLAHPWPGNVREVEEITLKLTALGQSGALEGREVDQVLWKDLDAGPLPTPGNSEGDRILEALNSTGSQQEASRLLDMSQVTLWRKMKSVGIEKEYVYSRRAQGFGNPYRTT